MYVQFSKETLSDCYLQIFEGPVCGNGFTEPGEQCDTSSSPCCDPATCRLVPGAECGAGPCCDTEQCRYRGQVYIHMYTLQIFCVDIVYTVDITL